MALLCLGKIFSETAKFNSEKHAPKTWGLAVTKDEQQAGGHGSTLLTILSEVEG